MTAFFRHPAARLGLLLLTAAGLCAQGVRGPRIPETQPIDPEEGAQRLAEFRQMRLAGDFAFQFKLEHKPRAGETFTYNGRMFGTWDEQGPLTRVEIWPGEPDESMPIKLLVRNGAEPRVWIKEPDAPARKVTGEALHEPLLPGLLLSAFDLQMPYLYWDDYRYEGSGRARGRPTQQFLLTPTPAYQSVKPEVAAIRLHIDDSFNVFVAAHMLDAEGERLKSFDVGRFQVIDEQAIVKSFELFDLRSRDETRLVVEAAALGLQLPEALFTLDGLTEVEAQVSPSLYQRL
ncbi:MAG: outer membrane lipoprotein-sorting protein [Verrucomicrobiota bacterium]